MAFHVTEFILLIDTYCKHFVKWTDLSAQVKVAADQARMAAATATGLADASATRNVAQAFAQAEEEEPQRPALGTTLSSLLSLARFWIDQVLLSALWIFRSQVVKQGGPNGRQKQVES